MKNKIETIVLSIILFVVPILIIPNIWGKYNILKIITLLICGLILLINNALKLKTLKIDTQDMLVLAFGILAIFSTIFSTNIKKSIIGETNRYEGLLTIITYTLIYYNAKYYFKNYKNFINIGTIVYISICVFAIIQFYIQRKIILLPLFGKGANGTFGNTNFMGSFVSIIMPAFILGYIFKNKKRFLIGSMASFSGMLVCGARSAMVAFVVSMLMITTYLIVKRKKIFFIRYFIVIICFILCFGGIYAIDKNKVVSRKVNVAKSEITQIATDGIKDNMGSGRIKIWRMTSKMIYKVPIFGCGVDALRDGLKELCTEEYIDYLITHKVYVDKTHNEYLQIAVTMGIPAVLVYLVFLGSIGIMGIKKVFKYKTIAIYIVMISAYLVQAFFNISTIGIAPIFWFILGITSRNLNKTKTE